MRRKSGGGGVYKGKEKWGAVHAFGTGRWSCWVLFVWFVFCIILTNERERESNRSKKEREKERSSWMHVCTLPFQDSFFNWTIHTSERE